ncbi:hypothetical protein [Burkholderia gladioli]|uniref:hypothetical protein n=1 Tax=Burkholderia gladioli TaxID=28095 RepID=UPI001F49486D|nr:hypothetical protein [Burkholderia gladioli]
MSLSRHHAARHGARGQTPAAALAARPALTLSGGVLVLPAAVAFGTVQAQERHPGYRHLLLPQARFARPCDTPGHLAPAGRARLHVAPPGRSLADLAADAALDLRDQLGSLRLARSTHVVVASCALDERIGASVVGRMQCELGLRDAAPLALGQNGTLGWYGALDLLDGMLDEGEQALVILSDKWLHPFVRQFGDLVGYGDAAAALLVSREAGAPREPVRAGGQGANWGELRGVALEFGPAIADPWCAAPEALREALAPLAARAIRRALEQARTPADTLDWCVPPGFDPAFVARVADAAAIPAGARVRHELAGHLSSSDSAASLIQLAASLDEGERRSVLVWDAALHGAAAAAVYDVTGGLHAALDIEGEAR